MAPQTRSRGVPPPSRVYHSTPAQEQAQFPPRRRVVRTYGKQTRRKDAMVGARTLRQQTLTQIDFVSSLEDDDRVGGDLDPGSEDEEQKESEGDVDSNKENRDAQDDDGSEVDEPVSSGRKRRASSRKTTAKDERAKRRRTAGDDTDTEPTPKKEKTSRRRTLGDLPTSSYHTQTLTQLLGRDPSHALCIQDSEDEDDENDENDENGFQNWLQDPTSPSPRRHRKASMSPTRKRQLRFASPKPSQEEAAERQESVVPQTPAKRTTRDVIPSSSQASTPASLMMGRYGPPGEGPSPLKNKSSPAAPRSILKELTGKPRIKTTPRRNERVIQDSFATDSWSSGGVMPLQERPLESPGGDTAVSAESSSLPDEIDTPTKPRRRGQSTELGDGKKIKAETGSPTPRKRVSPRKVGKRALIEIPDSDDDEDFEVFDENDEGGFVTGPETQLVMDQIASSEEVEEENDEDAKATTPTPTTTISRAATASSADSSRSRPRPSRSSPLPRPVASSQPTTLPPPSSSPKTPRPLAKRLRKPLHDPSAHASTPTQPLESQRVPLATLQALPAASQCTDVILPVDSDVLGAVVGGFRVHVSLPFRIPAQVVRFWLLGGEQLQYMACAEAGRVEAGGRSWRYDLPQVYELNNPVQRDDMREEGWFGDIKRYHYLPPAIIGQLMWNLRHALFRDVGDEEDEEEEQVHLLPSSSPPRPRDKMPAPTPTPSISVSQQVEAQLQSDIAHSTQMPPSDDILVPSTPETEHVGQTSSPTPAKRPSPQTAIKRPPPRLPALTPYTASSYRASRPPLNPNPPAGAVRPSQATTASQPSTPDRSSSHAAAAAPSRPPSYPQLHSSSSLLFHDDDDDDYSPPQIPPGLPLAADSSQLLSKSQMLSDSLVRDDALVPPEIWDSDEDVDGCL
ncbi:hypothetical protein AK830_g11833 [Neonectria ditissima]|uniref:Uncharacterized protein n=1 Tax=Neonectria ditissima TaxID=78410 RepID=A0A0P7B1R2_9HYPO|nr:hypothetical protein AK830_g11833 [Neonectria ditissima]